jgi:hypothetical protein
MRNSMRQRSLMPWLVFAITAFMVGLGIRRLAREAQPQEAGREGGDISSPPPGRRAGKKQIAAQDMEPCPRCGAYVLKGAVHDCRH